MGVIERMDHHDLARLLATASSELHRSPQEEPTLEAVVAGAVELVREAVWASITVRAPRRRGYATLAATSELAREADQLQYELAEGPCVDAAPGSAWLRSGEVATDARWPVWGARAGRLGVGSLLSLGLTSRGERIGALNMYAPTAGCFSDPDEVEVAVLYTVHAAQAMASSQLVSGLEVALSSRHLIGVAQGILMERFGLTQDRSFVLLRRISSQTNVKVTEVARRIVETNEVPTAR